MNQKQITKLAGIFGVSEQEFIENEEAYMKSLQGRMLTFIEEIKEVWSKVKLSILSYLERLSEILIRHFQSKRQESKRFDSSMIAKGKTKNKGWYKPKYPK